MIYVKIHSGDKKEIVAICDKELVGKKFSEGRLCLDVKEDFYKGEIANEEEVKEILRGAENLNLVGKKAVGIALKEKIIEENSVLKIKGVPHAQVYSF